MKLHVRRWIRFAARLRRRWRNLPRFARRVAINVVIGLTIEAALILGHETRFGTTLETVSLDWMIRMYSGTSPVADRPVLPFTIIDIDETTYRAWGEPVLLPRDRLRGLIEFSDARDPALIVVDIDLSRPTDAADGRLLEYLRARDRRPDGGRALAPLVFVRTFQEPIAGDPVRRARASILDAVRDVPGLHIGAPLFELDPDFVVRRWRLWEATCGNAHGDVVLSVQLLTAGLGVSGGAGPSPARSPSPAVGAYACRHRVSRSVGHAASPPELRLGDVTVHVNGTGLERRILYTVPWRLKPNQARPPMRRGDRALPLVIELSASLVVARTQEVADEAVHGRVVIIGGSYRDGRDIYATPLGAMPGTFVLLNAVHSLLQYGELRPPPTWAKLLVFVAVLVLTSVIFAVLHSLFALLVVAVVIGVGIVPLSFWLFRAGVWLEFWLPLAAVLAHHVWSEFEHATHGPTRAGHAGHAR